MPSTEQLKLIESLLALPDLKVTDFLEQENWGIIVQVSARNQKATCPRCGTKSDKLHQNHSFLVKDIALGEREVYLKINRRQFKCSRCKKPFSEDLSFLKMRRGYTKRLAEKIVKQVLNSNIRTVALQNNLTEDVVARMIKDVAEEKLEEKPKNLRKLGLDEIALVKGQGNYCAVLVDLEEHKLIGMLPSRKQEDLQKFFEYWGEEVLKNIEAVSIDLWKSYKSLIEKLMPEAEIIADRFHVQKAINRELDTKRKDLKRKALGHKEKSAEILQALTKSKYVLLKNQEDLTETQQEKLEQIKKQAPILGKMHEMKEEFREILEKNTNWVSGLDNLTDWLITASRLFPNSCKTIQRWFSEIVGYFESRITQGIVEGINNKLKLIKRSAYGFKNFDNFKLRSLLSWHFNC